MGKGGVLLTQLAVSSEWTVRGCMHPVCGRTNITICMHIMANYSLHPLTQSPPLTGAAGGG